MAGPRLAGPGILPGIRAASSCSLQMQEKKKRRARAWAVSLLRAGVARARVPFQL